MIIRINVIIRGVY